MPYMVNINIDILKYQGRFADPKPFVVHEVIDQGGEPIHTSDYYNLGKVTEFKGCGWLACIRNGDFNCLSNFGQFGGVIKYP